jgi:hypothetical protein
MINMVRLQRVVFGADDVGVGVSVDTVLHESARTRVVRRPASGLRPSGSVIWKESLGPEAVARARHEVAILARLAGVPGVAHLVEPLDDETGLVLEDVGGRTLTALLDDSDPAGRRALTGRDAVSFALALARVLAGVHAAGVIHKDVNPANILVCGPDRQPVLIDWELATTFAQEQPGFTHERNIVGTLAYLAPEQTGRTGRGVDARADLYALGATLYELVTGGPPFGRGDPLTLIHDHLARTPVAPSETNPDLPVILSDIVLRLLEKEPDRRYQSAQGLAYDLAELARLLAAPIDDDPAKPPARFTLGERDFPLRICAPSRLAGRDSEIGALRSALDSALTGTGRGLLVTGAPGVGKSALIDELRPMVTALGGWFIQGKFDQHRQDESSDAVTQALRGLTRLLLAEPEDQLRTLRCRLLAGIGPDAEVLAAVLPELSVLLGVAPAQIDTGDPGQFAARLRQASLGTLRALASPERPLVVVIDDLQWAGAFPITFLDAVLMDDALRGLLLVGAYREAEVDAAHPLSGTLARWERLLDAALALLRAEVAAEGSGAGGDGAIGDPLVLDLLIEQHAALVNLGRLDQADQVYAEIGRRADDPIKAAEAAAVQVVNLHHRRRPEDAVALGLDALASIGFAPPPMDTLVAEIERGLELLYRWVAEGPQPHELHRPELDDPRIVAATRLIERITPAAFLCRHPMTPWMAFQSHRFWIENGPCARLAACLGALPSLAIAIRQDYVVGYTAIRRILAVCEARGYEPATSQLRCAVANLSTPWFEPLEEAVRQARVGREGLLRYGELQYAAFSFLNTTSILFECAPTLDLVQAELDASMTFVARTGNESMAPNFLNYRQALRCLRGETDVTAGFTDSSFDETAHLAAVSNVASAAFGFQRLGA